MNASKLSRHALSRMGQRGFRDDDIDLIAMIGTEVDDGYLVLQRDCQAAERVLKSLSQRIQRLGGKRMVVAGGRIVTVYRAAGTTERSLMRRVEKRLVAS